MSSSKEVKVQSEDFNDEEMFISMFNDIDELHPFEIKKEEIAAQLTALLAFKKVSRSTFAAISGWKRSRVTNILNGNINLTYKTIWEFARHLGYEADINFRLPSQHHAIQPWQKRFDNDVTQITALNVATKNFESIISKVLYSYRVELQSSSEVANDLAQGNHKTLYASLVPIRRSDDNFSRLNSVNENTIPPFLNVPRAVNLIE